MILENLDIVVSFAVVMLLLSLLVTVAVQSLVELTNLRGWVLAVGVKKLLEQIDPSFKRDAKSIAEKILTHPAVSIQRLVKPWRKIKAIRPDELIRLLKKLAEEDSLTPIQSIAVREGSFKVPDWIIRTRQRLWRLPANANAQRNTIRDVLNQVESAHCLAIRSARRLKETLLGETNEAAKEMENLLQSVTAQSGSIDAKVTEWFDTVMDRTTEVFTAWTRLFTVVAAFLLAIFCHIDSLALIRQLSTNAELRSQLVQAADSTFKRAEETLAPTSNDKYLASLSLRAAAGDSALNALPEAKELKDIPDKLMTRLEGDLWLTDRLGSSDNLRKITDIYHSKFEAAAKDWIGELDKSTSIVLDDLQKTTLTIIPQPIPNWLPLDWKHVGGVAITAVLLSLGAPFWFNTLRTIANLRPQVAEKVEESEVGYGEKKK